jgi:hypothetical protein
MIPALLLTALLATPTDRLTALISKRQPRATYARELASRILIEGPRHNLRPEWLAGVAWVESDFNRLAKGKHGEHGPFQVMIREHGIADAWDWLRGNPQGFPLAMSWGAIPWGKLGQQRVEVLRSVREGTYIAAAMIAAHVALCQRMGHRIGRPRCYATPGGMRCIRRHPHSVDRVGHWNSGGRWPYPGYLRKLRRRSGAVARILRGPK